MMVEILRHERHRDVIYSVFVAYFGFAFRFISPLILYPFLTRRFGLDVFGVYAAAYSAALMISVVVEYGFASSGARDVASAAGADERGQVASRVVFAKLALIPIALGLGLAISLGNPVLKQHVSVAAAAVILGIGQGATASWFFQGIKRIGLAVAIEVTGQILALLIMIVVVRGPKDLLLAVLIQNVGSWSAVLIGHILMLRHCVMRYVGITGAIDALRDGFSLFIARSAIVFYTSASVFIISAFSSSAEAGLYSSSERIVSAATILFRPLSSTIMPRVASTIVSNRRGAFVIARFALTVSVTLFIVISIAMIILAPRLVQAAFGGEFLGAAPVLSTLALMLPFVAVSQVLGNILLVSLRKDAALVRAIVIGAIANIVLAVLIVPHYGAMGMAVSRLSTEFIVAAVYVAAVIPFLRELYPRKVLSAEEMH